MALGKEDYAERVIPSMRCAARCGNMYTASLYGGLASVLSTVEPHLRVKGDTSEIREKLDLINRLESMKVVPCEEFVDSLAVCTRSHLTLENIPD